MRTFTFDTSVVNVFFVELKDMQPTIFICILLSPNFFKVAKWFYAVISLLVNRATEFNTAWSPFLL
jgi:hypothetical protein